MNQSKDIVGTILICTLLTLLTIAGIISYRSIDWSVLQRLEGQKLVLPTPIIASPSAIITTPTATVSGTQK